MNIAIGKFGRSMYFDEKSWSIYAGDDSPKIFYFTLARRYPQHKFYIIGASDFADFKKKNSAIGFGNVFKKVDIPSNIIDLHAQAREFAGKEKCKERTDTHKKGCEAWRTLDEYVDHLGLKFDMGLFMQGPDASVSVGGEGIICATKPTEAIPMQMAANYCGPMIHLLNKQGFPWYNINEDPRYVPSNHKDIINHEILTFSQIESDKYSVKRLVRYNSGDYVEHKLHFKYAGLERMFMANMPKIDFSNPDRIEVNGNVYQKKRKFVLTLNDGTDRLSYLEKWVLDIHPEEKVYGKWGDEAKQKHPNTFIEKGIVQMQPEMWETMFTYVPAFDHRLPNFVTQKPWKMVYYGIIPFYDKNSYDTDGYFKEFPDYVKVSSPKEMWEKIDYLYEHRDEYAKLLKQFYDILEDKYFNGDFICDTFGPVIDAREKELNGTAAPAGRRIIKD